MPKNSPNFTKDFEGDTVTISPLETSTTLELKLPEGGYFRGRPDQSIESVQNELKRVLLFYRQFRLIPNGTVLERISDLSFGHPDIFTGSEWLSMPLEYKIWPSIHFHIPGRMEWKLSGKALKYIDDMIDILPALTDEDYTTGRSIRFSDTYKRKNCLISLPYANVHVQGDIIEEITQALEARPVYTWSKACSLGNVLVTDIALTKDLIASVETIENLRRDLSDAIGDIQNLI